jgi:hypothetical protein
MQFYCYLWLREDGTPYYVGKGKNNRAFEEHERLGVPINKEHIIVQDYLSEQEAFEAEIFFISYFGRKDLSTGSLRNFTNGGQGQSNPSLEIRYRIGNGNRGKQKSIESKLHQSNLMSGRQLSEEHKQKLRLAHARRKQAGLGNGRINFKHSEETKKRISETSKLVFNKGQFKKNQVAWNKGKKFPRKAA